MQYRPADMSSLRNLDISQAMMCSKCCLSLFKTEEEMTKHFRRCRGGNKDLNNNNITERADRGFIAFDPSANRRQQQQSTEKNSTNLLYSLINPINAGFYGTLFNAGLIPQAQLNGVPLQAVGASQGSSEGRHTSSSERTSITPLSDCEGSDRFPASGEEVETSLHSLVVDNRKSTRAASLECTAAIENAEVNLGYPVEGIASDNMDDEEVDLDATIPYRLGEENSEDSTLPCIPAAQESSRIVQQKKLSVHQMQLLQEADNLLQCTSVGLTDEIIVELTRTIPEDVLTEVFPGQVFPQVLQQSPAASAAHTSAAATVNCHAAASTSTAARWAAVWASSPLANLPASSVSFHDEVNGYAEGMAAQRAVLLAAAAQPPVADSAVPSTGEEREMPLPDDGRVDDAVTQVSGSRKRKTAHLKDDYDIIVMCGLCHVRPSTTVFRPCGHSVMCRPCGEAWATNIGNCPQHEEATQIDRIEELVLPH